MLNRGTHTGPGGLRRAYQWLVRRLLGPRQAAQLLARLPADRAGVRLVVGLGNPGAAYARTRHNVGFLCVEALAERRGATWVEARGVAESLLALAADGPDALLLAKPLTYMNDSGRALKRLLEVAGVEPPQALVVYDDMDLPLGVLRLRQRGSAGSHNGMRSIVAALASDDVPRLRIGIGQAAALGARDYVLSPFASAEQATAAAAVARAAEAAVVWATSGPGAAMNRFNASARLDATVDATVDGSSLVP